MHNTPLISIVIPTFNQSRFIAKTIQSVFEQTYPNYELIIVNDGSTDDTDAILSRFGSDLQIIKQQNQGLASARNTGLQRSSGEYILFLDSDDILLPRALEQWLSFLINKPEYGAVYSAWQQIDPHGSIVGEVHPQRDGLLLNAILRREIFFFSSMTLIRRSSLEQVGPYNPQLRWSEDSDMWLRLSLAGCRFGYIDQPLTQYRVHTSSMTAGVNAAQIAAWMKALDHFFSSPGLPSEISAMRDEACAILHFETAGRYFRTYAIHEAQHHLNQGVKHFGRLDSQWFLNWLAGTALDPRTENPRQFIDLVLNSFHSEMHGLKPLRRKAHAQFHAAAAFSAYQAQTYKQVHQHAWQAIRNRPALLFNRGLMKIMVSSYTR